MRFKLLFIGFLLFSSNSFASDINLEMINNDNCKREYDKCMNSQCYNDGFGRCACSGMAETNISEEKRDGLKGIGYSFYMQQKSRCAVIADKCPTLSRKVVSEYKMAMNNDCAQLALGNIKENLKEAAENSYFAKYEKFKSCMRPFCSKSNDSNLQFSNCFTIENINAVGGNCNMYADSPEAFNQLKEEFAGDMSRMKSVYCDRIGSGEMVKNPDSNVGECVVEIAFGYYKANNIGQIAAQESLQTQETGMKIFATKKFKIGEVVDCSEAGFNAKAKGIIDNTAKLERITIKTEKIRMVGDLVNLTGNVITSAANLTGTAAADASKFQKVMFGINKFSGAADSILGLTMGIMEASMKNDMLEERSKYIMDTSKNNLFCFIDQIPFIQEGSKFRLNWIE